MKYKTKSILISRTSRKDSLHPDPEGQLRPCMISLFNENDPHKKGLEPERIISFEGIHKIIINDMKEINFLLPGSDLLVNNLRGISVEQEGPHLKIVGE